MGVEFTKCQANAIPLITNWYQNQSKQVFRLFGFAGTGKSYTVEYIMDELGINKNTEVKYATFTRKSSFNT